MPALKEQKPSREIWSALSLLGQLGWVVAAPIVIGVVAGRSVDRWLGTHGIALAILILVGVAAGAYGAYRLCARVIAWKP